MLQNIDLVWVKLFEYTRRNHVLVFNIESATALFLLRVAPLGAVVTRKVRIINDYSLDVEAARGEKAGLNRGKEKE